ncbi:C2 family cysteine protease [Streptomyces sp. NPDC000609]|uniref:C2 family cysteine protease n=1 Tax=Streptomyces sp. NPDC000609 TaxID=3160957 RepID=UPI003393611A
MSEIGAGAVDPPPPPPPPPPPAELGASREGESSDDADTEAEATADTGADADRAEDEQPLDGDPAPLASETTAAPERPTDPVDEGDPRDSEPPEQRSEDPNPLEPPEPEVTESTPERERELELALEPDPPPEHQPEAEPEPEREPPEQEPERKPETPEPESASTTEAKPEQEPDGGAEQDASAGAAPTDVPGEEQPANTEHREPGTPSDSTSEPALPESAEAAMDPAWPEQGDAREEPGAQSDEAAPGLSPERTERDGQDELHPGPQQAESGEAGAADGDAGSPADELVDTTAAPAQDAVQVAETLAEVATDAVERVVDAADERAASASVDAVADAGDRGLAEDRGLRPDASAEPSESESDGPSSDADPVPATEDARSEPGAETSAVEPGGRAEAPKAVPDAPDDDDGDDVQGQPDGGDSGRLAGTVDRPSYSSDGPDDEIPDRYGTPLDRADGTRTPLFDGDPSREQAQQGGLGDCGVIATLGAVASHRPDAIRERVRETEDGNYAVALHEARFDESLDRYEPTGRHIVLTVTPDLPVFDDRPDEPAFADSVETGAAWGPVMEKAIAGSDQTWGEDRQDAWARSDHGAGDVPEGYARLDLGSDAWDQAEMLTQLTGEPAVVVDFPERDDAAGRSPDEQLVGDIRERLAEGKPVIVGTHPKEEFNGAPLEKDLVDGHAYEVIAVDDEGQFHLHNPWNDQHPEPLTVAEFRRYIDPPYTTLE